MTHVAAEYDVNGAWFASASRTQGFDFDLILWNCTSAMTLSLCGEQGWQAVSFRVNKDV